MEGDGDVKSSLKNILQEAIKPKPSPNVASESRSIEKKKKKKLKRTLPLSFGIISQPKSQDLGACPTGGASV